MDDLFLARDFPARTEADWLTSVDKALAGASPRSLETPLYENFSTKPLYTQTDDVSPAPLFQGRGWLAVQTLEGSGEVSKIAAQLDRDIAGGLDGLLLDLTGVPIANVAQLKAVFGKALAKKPLALYLTGTSSLLHTALLITALEGVSLKGGAGLDPLTAVALSGEISADRTALFADAMDAACYLQAHHPEFTPFVASDQAWHLGGGSAVHELGFTLAAAVAYWRALTDGGLSLKAGAPLIGFSLTASTDIFVTIAKFRALRLVWNRALEAANVNPATNMSVLAEMSPQAMTERDAHGNVLRGTAAAFGAVLGGASAIHILPFNRLTATSAQDLAAARRLALNTSHILRNESWLAAVADTAHGSWYVESLTASLAERAWDLFREVEAQGGLAIALENGFVNATLNPTRIARETAVARRKDKIVGVSAFPNLNEALPLAAYSAENIARPLPQSDWRGIGNLKLPLAANGERFAALVEAARAGANFATLGLATKPVTDLLSDPMIQAERASEPFEMLRRQSDLALENLGSRPPIFIARVGEAAPHRARLLWLQSFFATGGVEAIVPRESFSTLEALMRAFLQNPSPIACLCGVDAAYSDLQGAAATLKAAGAILVYLAAPAKVLTTLVPADIAAIDRLIYEGCDAFQLLEELHIALRVEDLSAEDADAEAMEL